METLAYLHLALAYEESPSVEAVTVLPKLNLLALLKQQKSISKAWIYGLSLSLTLILLRIFTSALALQIGTRESHANNLTSTPNSQTESIQKTKNNLSASNLISHTESIQKTKNNLSASNLISQTKPIQKTRNSLLTSNPISQTKPIQANQKGKLRLINDTPYIGIVTLYKSDGQFASYAHIPPFHRRELHANYYSNQWRISFNNHKKFSIGEVSNRESNVFEVKASTLNVDEQLTGNYPYNTKSQPVTNLPSWLWFNKGSKQFQKSRNIKNLASKQANMSQSLQQMKENLIYKIKELGLSEDEAYEVIDCIEDLYGQGSQEAAMNFLSSWRGDRRNLQDIIEKSGIYIEYIGEYAIALDQATRVNFEESVEDFNIDGVRPCNLAPEWSNQIYRTVPGKSGTSFTLTRRVTSGEGVRCN